MPRETYAILGLAKTHGTCAAPGRGGSLGTSGCADDRGKNSSGFAVLAVFASILSPARRGRCVYRFAGRLRGRRQHPVVLPVAGLDRAAHRTPRSAGGVCPSRSVAGRRGGAATDAAAQ